MRFFASKVWAFVLIALERRNVSKPQRIMGTVIPNCIRVFTCYAVKVSERIL
jgi:hypothetical protein